MLSTMLFATLSLNVCVRSGQSCHMCKNYLKVGPIPKCSCRPKGVLFQNKMIMLKLCAILTSPRLSRLLSVFILTILQKRFFLMGWRGGVLISSLTRTLNLCISASSLLLVQQTQARVSLIRITMKQLQP